MWAVVANKVLEGCTSQAGETTTFQHLVTFLPDS